MPRRRAAETLGAMTRAAALLLVLALALAAAGCGGGKKEPTAQDWANGVCSAVSTWTTSLKSIGSSLTSDPTMNGLKTAKDDLNTANDKFVGPSAYAPSFLERFKTDNYQRTISFTDVGDPRLSGPAASDIAAYLQSKNLGAEERIRLFRLAWDTALSDFAGRQELYEYYFFGDPVRMAGAYVAGYDREPYKAAVRAFLDRG